MSAEPDKYDTLRPRFYAFCVDVVVLSPAAIAGIWVNLSYTDRAFVATCNTGISIVGIAYWVSLHGLFGQTLGKKLCGVVVLDLDESKLSMKQAVLRFSPEILRLLLYIAVAVYLIQTGNGTIDPKQRTIVETVLSRASSVYSLVDIGIMLWSTKNRALHDYIAGSVVVRCDE